MSLQIRPGYVNPLAAMRENKSIMGQKGNVQDGESNKLTELRTKKQSLQTEMILMQTTGSDASGNTSKKLDALKTKLEEVSADLRTAMTDKSGSVSAMKSDIDTYEKAEKKSQHPGIYQFETNSENSYKISFLPYTDS